MHPAYYHQAHACILCFDVTRKATYKNLPSWLKELRDYRSKIPTICIANKVDVDMKVMSKDFAFPKKHGMPLCEYRVELGHAQARAAPSSCHSCHSSLLSPPVFPPPPPLPALSLPFSSDVSAHASAFSSLLRDLPVLPFASFSLTRSPARNVPSVGLCSAADGTNVVAAFEDAINAANVYANSDQEDFADQVLALLNETAGMSVGGADEAAAADAASEPVPAS